MARNGSRPKLPTRMPSNGGSRREDQRKCGISFRAHAVQIGAPVDARRQQTAEAHLWPRAPVHGAPAQRAPEA